MSHACRIVKWCSTVIVFYSNFSSCPFNEVLYDFEVSRLCRIVKWCSTVIVFYSNCSSFLFNEFLYNFQISFSCRKVKCCLTQMDYSMLILGSSFRDCISFSCYGFN
eukprot:Selendium_serpulae@DN6436_c3_g1_i8.p1